MTAIRSVSDCIKLVERLISTWNKQPHPFGNAFKTHGFGVWARGESCNYRTRLLPDLLRDKELMSRGAELFHLAKAVCAQSGNMCRSELDWVTLFRHHGFPTRLLDWTESALSALFFAVEDVSDHDKDGVLYVLNALRLGRVAAVHRGGIKTVDSFDALVRCMLSDSSGLEVRGRGVFEHHGYSRVRDVHLEAMARLHMGDDMSPSPTEDVWKRALVSPLGGDGACCTDWQEYLARLSIPLPLIPNRNNQRIVAQLGTFTLHGSVRERQPAHLLDVSNRLPREQQFLRAFCIPSDAKSEVRGELIRVGVRSGALFPDLDGQLRSVCESLVDAPFVENRALCSDKVPWGVGGASVGPSREW